MEESASSRRRRAAHTTKKSQESGSTLEKEGHLFYFSSRTESFSNCFAFYFLNGLFEQKQLLQTRGGDAGPSTLSTAFRAAEQQEEGNREEGS